MSELLRYFSQLSAVALRFLEADYFCRRVEGFSQFDGYPGQASLRTSDFSQAPGLFLYVVRYLDSDVILDFSYGDRELLIEPMLIYPAHQLRFYPSELLSAAGTPRAGNLSGGTWVRTRDYMEQIITEFAAFLRPHWPFLRQPGHEVLDRALVQRGRKMLFAQEEQRRRDRERACIQASEAFHARNHRRAIELLRPFLDDSDLPPASRKLYELASKYNDATET